MISSLSFFTLEGKILVNKFYRDDITLSEIKLFKHKIIEKEKLMNVLLIT